MSTEAFHRFDNQKRRRGDDNDRQRMLTPSYVLEPIRELLGGIDLDPCTETDNPTQALNFYALPEDGCVLPWNGNTIFCNPPYGEARNRWVHRCVEEKNNNKKIVLLIPNHTETKTAQLALSQCCTALFVRARLRFIAVRKNGRHEAASHGSILFGFNVNLRLLEHLGVVMVNHG